jgi:hypothetical protein
MGSASWPYIDLQCPCCTYLQAIEPFIDDSGYEIVGFCRHPRIAMELFRARERRLSEGRQCPLFIPSRADPDGPGRSPA